MQVLSEAICEQERVREAYARGGNETRESFFL